MIRFREGDRVSVMGTVKYNQRTKKQVFVEIDGSYSSVALSPGEITMVAPKVEVGEFVCFEPPVKGFNAGTVLAQHGDAVWIQHASGNSLSFSTIAAASVVRSDEPLDDEPETAPPPAPPAPPLDGNRPSDLDTEPQF